MRAARCPRPDWPEGGHCPGGSPVSDTPPPAAARPRASSGSWNLPDTAPRCFQHLRRGAEPLLHSRKIFVQGLGTAEEEMNATLEPSGRCFVCACGAPLSAAGLGIPPHAPPACCQLFCPLVRNSTVGSVSKHLRSRLCARHRAGPWTLLVNQGPGLTFEAAVRVADQWKGR